MCRNFDPNCLPLPTEFTAESLAALRRQVGETLTLESLAHLGNDNIAPDASWPATKGFVGGGDLNAVKNDTNGTSRPSLVVEVQGQRNRSASIRSIDGAPSPVPSHASLFPDFLPPTAPGPSAIRAPVPLPSLPSTPAHVYPPVPLPSPMSALLEPRTAREFKTLNLGPSNSTSPSWSSPLSAMAASASPTYLSAANLHAQSARERDIYASTPHGDGAVSPALSSSSKTDMFFATSQRDSLPMPPKPLSSTSERSLLGRTPSIGRGIPPIARARVVTTPAPVPTSDSISPSPSTSPTLPAPTPLRSVTGPIQSPHSSTPSPSLLSPRPPVAVTTTSSSSRHVDHAAVIAREAHHGEVSETLVHAGDVLTPIPDDDNALPIRSPSSTTAWRLRKPLGQGAFAAVWSAEPATATAQDGESSVAAVKLVDRAACRRNARNAIAFYREVEVLRHLVHPGIVGYVAHFSTAAHHCLVLEQLSGGELFALVEDDKNRKRMLIPGPGDNIGEGLVRRIFGELCRAVAWLHEVEVVHRDIKLESECNNDF